MKKSRIIAIISIIALITLSGCGNTSISNFPTTTVMANEQENEFDYGKFFPTIDEETGISVDMVSNAKNKDIEMQINHNGYAETELQNLISHTAVRMYNVCSSDNNYDICYCGNIYDIDDNYIYILTCRHAFNNANSDIIKSIYFSYDNTCITPQNYTIKLSPQKDIGLIIIDKNEIPIDTLNNLKSINISESFSFNPEKVDWFLFSYDFLNRCNFFGKFSVNCNYTRPNLNDNSKIKDGFSGSGYFDQYGRYLGLHVNMLAPEYYNIPLEVYLLINQ